MIQLQSIKGFYNTGATISYDFRKTQLHALENAIKKYEDEINAALYADLKKSKEETWVTETGLLLGEIKYAIKNLHKWMKPKKVSTGLATFPSSAKIYHDSLGVVLIIAPWNYPLQLLLIPLVGAISAGNCSVLKPSEMALATEKIIVKIIEETFDANYIKVITGNGAEVVPEMINTFRFDHIFYTGAIDAFFNYEFGRLGYRTVTFESSVHNGDFQGVAQMNYCDENIPYTRITEHKHFTPWEQHEKTIIFKEYSKETGADEIPYYPKRLKQDMDLLHRYREKATSLKNVSFLGRLATYRYMDMHHVIGEALDFSEIFLAAFLSKKILPVFPNTEKQEINF